jgi:hypothetical protein
MAGAPGSPHPPIRPSWSGWHRLWLTRCRRVGMLQHRWRCGCIGAGGLPWFCCMARICCQLGLLVSAVACEAANSARRHLSHSAHAAAAAAASPGRRLFRRLAGKSCGGGLPAASPPTRLPHPCGTTVGCRSRVPSGLLLRVSACLLLAAACRQLARRLSGSLLHCFLHRGLAGHCPAAAISLPLGRLALPATFRSWQGLVGLQPLLPLPLFLRLQPLKLAQARLLIPPLPLPSPLVLVVLLLALPPLRLLLPLPLPALRSFFRLLLPPLVLCRAPPLRLLQPPLLLLVLPLFFFLQQRCSRCRSLSLPLSLRRGLGRSIALLTSIGGMASCTESQQKRKLKADCPTLRTGSQQHTTPKPFAASPNIKHGGSAGVCSQGTAVHAMRTCPRRRSQAGAHSVHSDLLQSSRQVHGARLAQVAAPRVHGRRGGGGGRKLRID